MAGVLFVVGMGLIVGFVILFIPVLVVLEVRRNGAGGDDKAGM